MICHDDIPVLKSTSKMRGTLLLSAFALTCTGCGNLNELAGFLLRNTNFWPQHTIDSSSNGADGVRTGDADGDGLLDLVVPWEEGGVVRLYLNPGPDATRLSWPQVTVGRVSSPEDASMADLDGDGWAEVISCAEGDTESIFIHWAPHESFLLNENAWTTQAIPAAQKKFDWLVCVAAQIDGENGVDIVAGSKGSDAQLGWLRAPADARDLNLWTWNTMADARWIMSIIPLDIDRDGDMDVLATDRKGPQRGIYWFENPGTAPQVYDRWSARLLATSQHEVMFMDVNDLDGDGILDIVAATDGHEILVLKGTSADRPTWRTTRVSFTSEVGTGKAVKILDVNLDGQQDVCLSTENSAERFGLAWLSYRTSMEDRLWDTHYISGLRGSKYDLIETLDLDGDTDWDAITTEEGANLGVIWYENPER
jgi:hypothetical protein